MSDRRDKIKAFFRRRWHWVLGAVILVVSVCFFADLTIFGYFRTKSKVRQLKSEMAHYEELIARDSLFLEGLKDDAFLEKYAREKHLMYADDEQLFVIEE
jgi:cell division protein FtsB